MRGARELVCGSSEGAVEFFSLCSVRVISEVWEV